MAEENLPPQNRSFAFAAAGGGFGGALLAIIVAKILEGPCCCQAPATEVRPMAKPVTTVTAVMPAAVDGRASGT